MEFGIWHAHQNYRSNSWTWRLESHQFYWLVRTISNNPYGTFYQNKPNLPFGPIIRKEVLYLMFWCASVRKSRGHNTMSVILHSFLEYKENVLFYFFNAFYFILFYCPTPSSMLVQQFGTTEPIWGISYSFLDDLCLVHWNFCISNQQEQQ